MAQHDYVIDNGPGLTVRTDINAALAAIQSSNSGAVEPASKVPGQVWFNTTTGQLVYRNTGNTAWNPVGGLSTDGLTLFLKEGTTTRGSVAASSGTDPGTIALRAFNNAGSQVGLFYLNSGEIGTDRNTLSISNVNDEAVWFRQANGVIRGGVYNYTSGRTELRAYTGGALKNLLGIDEGISGFTYALVWTYNSNAAAGDVWISHRVSGTRAMRWYFAQSGDIFLQESDDNYGSHFINVFAYSRGTNNVSIPNYLQSPGHLLTGMGGSNNGLFNGTGDGASPSVTNVWLRSWWGIGFPSATDNVTRIYFDCRSGRMSANEVMLPSGGGFYFATGAGLWSDGNIAFTGGMTAWGATLHAALTNINNAANNVYTGSNANETNFPIGHHVFVTDSNNTAARNENRPVCLGTANWWYGVSGQGAALAGTWRLRGGADGDSRTLWQRTA